MHAGQGEVVGEGQAAGDGCRPPVGGGAGEGAGFRFGVGSIGGLVVEGQGGVGGDHSAPAVLSSHAAIFVNWSATVAMAR